MRTWVAMLAVVLAVVGMSVVVADEPVTAHCEGGIVGLDFGAATVPNGHWMLCVENGQVHIRPMALLKVIPGPNPPPDDPLPLPDDSVLSETAKKVKAAAQAVTGDASRAETAQALAQLIEESAKTVTDGNQLKVVIKFGMAFLLQKLEVTSQWAAAVAVINAQVDSASGDVVQVKKVLEEIVIGLRAASPNARPQIDIATIMMIIELIMKILEMFKDSAMTPDTLLQIQALLQDAQQVKSILVVPQVAP